MAAELAGAPAAQATAPAQQADAAAQAGTEADKAGTAQPRKSGDDGIFSLDNVIVTGTGQAQAQFDASFAITSLQAEQIDKLAVTNFAELMGTMPGIYAESNAGEVQNVYRIRGIPDEGSFVVVQEDGMSPYPENSGYFFKTEGLVRTDLMTESVEAVRGGPSPVFASNAAAIVNMTTREGSDTPEGAVRTTLGSTGLYRLDGYWSGPVAKDTYLAVGGFVRKNEGYRDVDFDADKGGQLRANLTRKFEQGKLNISLKHLDDRNAFYMPIPLYDPRDNSVSMDNLFDRFDGTLSTSQLENSVIRWGDSDGSTYSENRDLSDGRHIKYDNLGASLDWAFDNGWNLSNKFAANTLDMTFDALYSSSNPADADTYAANRLAEASAAFDGVASLGYIYTDDGSTFDPSTTNGLVIQGQYRAMKVKAHSVADDLRLTRTFDWGDDTHDITLGLYGAYYTRKYSSYYQSYLFESKENPRLIDLVAYDSSGNIVGSVTDDGVVYYASSASRGASHVSLLAPYIADTWQATDKLRLEAGIRHERYDYSSWSADTESGDLGMEGTLADDSAKVFTGTNTHENVIVSVNSWTAGFNYDLTPVIGFYGRASRANRAPSEGVASTSVTVTRADQYELGVKLNFAKLDVFATAFYTKYDPYSIGIDGVDPDTGESVEKDYVGDVVNPGIELAAVWTPLNWLRLDANATYNDTEISSLTEVSDDGVVATIDVDGNMPNRQPKMYGNLSSTFLFSTGAYDWQAYLRYNYVGKRYADVENTTVLPAYHTLNVGVTLTHGPWDLQFSVNNLTNEFGLNEGNPRTDTISGQGSSTAIYGRPIYGRNGEVVFTWHF